MLSDISNGLSYVSGVRADVSDALSHVSGVPLDVTGALSDVSDTLSTFELLYQVFQLFFSNFPGVISDVR